MKQGLYWHVHHDILLEWCWGWDERVEVIKTTKPESEISIRLKLFQPVKGKLPKEVTSARDACDSARDAYDSARNAYDKTLKKHTKAIEALHKKECPDCPWDGKKIVFSKAKK